MATEDVSIKALASKFDTERHIPAYNTPAFAKAFAADATAAAGTNSVRLVSEGKEGLPLSHAAHGETYTVQLANFPKSTDLTVQLIGSQEVVEAGQTVAKQTAAPLGTVQTDKNGVANIEWDVPADTPAGTYYIKATDATGAIFGMSPALDIVQEARRKLYGPLVEL